MIGIEPSEIHVQAAKPNDSGARRSQDPLYQCSLAVKDIERLRRPRLARPMNPKPAGMIELDRIAHERRQVGWPLHRLKGLPHA